MWQGFVDDTPLTCHQLDFVALLEASAPYIPRISRSGKRLPRVHRLSHFLVRPVFFLITKSKLHARAHARLWKSSRVVMDPFPALPRPTAFWAAPREIPGVFPGHPTRHRMLCFTHLERPARNPRRNPRRNPQRSPRRNPPPRPPRMPRRFSGCHGGFARLEASQVEQ